MSASGFARVLRLIAVVGALPLSWSCDGGTTGPEPTPQSLQLTPPTATILLGDSVQLLALYSPGSDPARAAGTVVWTTSDDGIATVDAGLVRAVSPGKATIAARIGTLSAIATVTVDTMALSPVRGGVFQRLGGVPVAGVTVTIRAYAVSGCSGAAVRALTTTTASDGTFASTIALPRFGAPGGDCVTVDVAAVPMPAAPPGRTLLAGATLRLRWGDDVIPRVLSFFAFVPMQPADPPPPLPGNRTWLAVSAGSTHTCALDSDGHPWCWGANRYGQLGASAAQACLSFTGSATVAGTMPCGLEPLPSTTNATLTSLSSGGSSTCGLAAAGELYCWGGQVAASPALVPALPFAAFDGTCGLDSGGIAHCWYSGSPLSGVATVPAAAPPFTRIAAWGASYCGLDAGGQAWCWGMNDAGQVGNGRAGPVVTDPAALPGGHLFRDIRRGGFTTCALATDGAAWCWGSDAYGQLGSGRTAREYCPSNPSWIPPCASAPLRVSSDQAFASITVGGAHVCALNAAGVAYCWGSNAAGQLGLSGGDTPPHTAPEAVPTPLRFRALSAGGSHTCGITLSGGLYCWGDNSYGQLGEGTVADRSQPTRVSGSTP